MSRHFLLRSSIPLVLAITTTNCLKFVKSRASAFQTGTAKIRRGSCGGSFELPKPAVYCSFPSFSSRRFSSMTSSISSLPPLIDVDCNLWHKDLQGPLLPTPSLGDGSDISAPEEETNAGANDHDTPLPQSTSPFDILIHDAVMEQNIRAVLSPSSTIQESKMGVNLLLRKSEPTAGLPQILTTVGIHPYHVCDDDIARCRIEENMDRLRSILDNEQMKGVVAAIGECGLDGSEGFPPIQDQIPYFQQQVELAQYYNLPLFVHERLAFDQCMDILTAATSVPIIIHCFTGNPEECKQYVDSGYFLSVSGYICKDVGQSVRQCLQDGLIPLDKLMVETDSPYLGFPECRKKYIDKHADEIQTLNAKKRKRLQKSTYPNVPSSLPLVVDAILDCLNAGRAERGEEAFERDEVARQMSRNAIKFFGFDPIDGL